MVLKVTIKKSRNSVYGEYEILRKVSRDYVEIQFLKTGTKIEVDRNAAREGYVKDHNAVTFYGVGFLGYGKFNKTEYKKVYNTWYDMLSRCYCDRRTDNTRKRYNFLNVTVDERWHCFQNFGDWFVKNYIEGFHLDKDLKMPNSRVYSPETCEFIPQEINNLLGSCNWNRGRFPVGVNKETNSNSFRAKIRTGTGVIHKSGFKNPDEAFLFYKKHKEAFIKQKAEEHYAAGNISKTIYENLLNWQIEKYPQ